MKSFTIEKLKVRVYNDRQQLGAAAAADVSAHMKEVLGKKDRVRMVFAAAPSQNELLDGLARAEGLEWSRVTAFQMDEYMGIPGKSKETHRSFLKEKLFSRVKPGEVHFIDGQAPPKEECDRYADLIGGGGIDIVCLGIGNNGHIAFNEPHAADFKDPQTVKAVEIDRVSIRQLTRTGPFARATDVPRFALTLTIPALMSGARLFCVVPGVSKREAVRQALQGSMTPQCPATILRTHPDCTLYLELDAHGK
jgi:glucosamine-6-phosphate deaminase